VYPGLAAATLGIGVVEVHVTLSREMFGPDVVASVTTAELRQLVDGVRFIERMLNAAVGKVALALETAGLRRVGAAELKKNYPGKRIAESYRGLVVRTELKPDGTLDYADNAGGVDSGTWSFTERNGGMMLPDQSRRRTPGGVFFALARKKLSPEDREAIFPKTVPAKKDVEKEEEPRVGRPDRRHVRLIRPAEPPRAQAEAAAQLELAGVKNNGAHAPQAPAPTTNGATWRARKNRTDMLTSGLTDVIRYLAVTTKLARRLRDHAVSPWPGSNGNSLP
jgi:hypothetical protein